MLDVRFPDANRCIVKIIGVGGAGGNAVGRMFSSGMKDVFFAICNTDFQDLNRSDVPCKIQIGEKLTKGLGAGANAEVGKNAALESEQMLSSLFEDEAVIFITAGMGGGTGTGAAPEIARMARKRGLLTIGIVTLPFRFEQPSRIQKALSGVKEMLSAVDSLIVINNQRLAQSYENLSVSQAFKKADEILASAAAGIADIVAMSGLVNVDLADVKSVLKDGGVTIMNTGEATGNNRVIDALHDAMSAPLLRGRNVSHAKNILLNIYSPVKEEVTMREMEGINKFFENFKQSEKTGLKEVFWGQTLSEQLDKQCRVTMIATGFDLDAVCDVHLYGDNAEEKETTAEEPEDWIDLDDDVPAYKKMGTSNSKKNL